MACIHKCCKYFSESSVKNISVWQRRQKCLPPVPCLSLNIQVQGQRRSPLKHPVTFCFGGWSSLTKMTTNIVKWGLTLWHLFKPLKSRDVFLSDV